MKDQTELLPTFIKAMEWLPIGMFVFDTRQNIIVDCNKALTKQFNYTDKVSFFQNGPFSPTPKYQQPFEDFGALIQEASSSKKKLSLRLRLDDKTDVYAEILIEDLPIGDQRYLLLIFNDVSKRRGFKHQLQDSQNTLEAVINTAVDGIIIINPRGIIQMANRAAQKLFGYPLEDVLDQNVKMLMPEPHTSRHDEYIDNYHRTGEQKIIGIGREVSGKRKDGQLFPLRLAVSKVVTEQGHLFVGVIHDLTNQKAAEQKILKLNHELEKMVEERTEKLTEVVNKLLQSNIKLEQEIREKEAAESALLKNEEELKEALEKEKELNELKSRFVSMASHEFRTPLTTIASSSDLLGMYTQTEQQAKREKHLKRIQSAVTNLTGVLGDFLSLSKLEEGKIHIHPVEFNLEQLMNEAVEDMSSVLKKGQRINKSFTNTNQIVTLDKKLLKNVLINLLSNAIKYSEAKSTIWLEASMDNQMITASLRDEGIGIPEGDQKHLFSRFFRAENAINIQGTGLGLNIVKRYLDLMDGSIIFESTQGIGTTFHFKIPV